MITSKRQLNEYIKKFCGDSCKEVISQMNSTPNEILMATHISLLLTTYLCQLSHELGKEIYGDTNDA